MFNVACSIRGRNKTTAFRLARKQSDTEIGCRDTIKEIDEMLQFIDENVETVKAAFARYDEEGQGRIPTEKLLKLLRSLGLNPTEEEFQQMINETDTDKDGYIGFIEFLELMKDLWGVVDKMQLLGMFDDGTGTVETSEMGKLMFDVMTVEEIEAMFASMDIDCKGQGY